MEIDSIPPLKPSYSNKKGRPSLWNDCIPSEYLKLLGMGYRHHEIITAWGVSEHTFRNWTHRSDILKKAYHATPEAQTFAKPEPLSYNKDVLRQLANETLQDLIAGMKTRPSAFKPQEIITACREALDRTDGKAAQSVTVESRQTITHEHLMHLDPAEAYRRLIEGTVIIPDCIDIEPVSHQQPRGG